MPNSTAPIRRKCKSGSRKRRFMQFDRKGAIRICSIANCGLANRGNFRHCWDNLVVGVTEFIVAGGQILVADLVNGGLNWRADERSDDLPVLDVVRLGAAAITGFDWITRQTLQRHLFSNVTNLKLALVGGKALGHVARLAWLGRLAFAALAQVAIDDHVLVASHSVL